MANAIYQKYVANDRGAWVLNWGNSRHADATGTSYYTGYNFNPDTGDFTLTGETFLDTFQGQRWGYQKSGSQPIRIYTYSDHMLAGGKNDLYDINGSISYQPNRPDRYYRGKLLETVKLPYGSVPDNGAQDGYWYVFQRMASPLWTRVGGVWYPGSGLSGRVDGVWKTEEKLSARVGGIWY